MMKRRVVITGMGTITSLGLQVNAFWQAIKQGTNGISRIERIDVADLPTQVAAEIKDFSPEQYMDKKESKRTDRFSQYALAAAQMAVAQAQLEEGMLRAQRVGMIIGTGIGGLETLEQ